GALVHGDLLGQNLRIDFDGEPGVIDWEYAMLGDPAHDLAIVARGARRPFQSADGRARLLEAYNTRASFEVTKDDLRFFELALHVRWFTGCPDRKEDSRPILARLLATG
ncbi:MAG TPA: phosphotransferase, partial [Nannocystis sp.]